MKAVLISIQPKWCELIASGKKTVEVRKTKPKIETPFKYYIYCTHNNHKYALHTYINSGYGRENFGVIGNWRSGKDVVDVNAHLPAYRYNAYLAEGKVIGEFVCDRFIESFLNNNDGWFAELGCLSKEEIDKYQGDKAILYGWHISDLVIYDKPKELREFKPYNRTEDDCKFSNLGYAIPKCEDCHECYVKRPPQSWCYVEELKGE